MIILDLCGGTGAWSKPYADAGYDVRVITLPENDVLTYVPPDDVHGILAAPPCTYFSRMRMCWGKPTKDQLREALEVVGACLKIIWSSQPVWWAMENPEGYLHDWIGEPRLKFNPYEYGDPWTKKTWIWGNFTIPPKLFPVRPKGRLISGGKGRKGFAHNFTDRARTPSGFAHAFFDANR